MPLSMLDTNTVDAGPRIITDPTYKPSKLKMFFSGLALGALGFIAAPIWAFYKGFSLTYTELTEKTQKETNTSSSNRGKISWLAMPVAVVAGLLSFVINTPSSLFLAPFEASKLGAKKGVIKGLKLLFKPVTLAYDFHKEYEQWVSQIAQLSTNIEDVTKLSDALKKVPKLIQINKKLQKMYDRLLELELSGDDKIDSQLTDTQLKLKILKNILILCDMVALVEKKVNTYISKNTNVGLAILGIEGLKKNIQKVLELTSQTKTLLIENNYPKNLLNLLTLKINNLKVSLGLFADVYDIDKDVINSQLNFLGAEEQQQPINGMPQPSSTRAMLDGLNTNVFRNYKFKTTNISTVPQNIRTNLNIFSADKDTTGDTSVDSYITFPKPKPFNQTKPQIQPQTPPQQKGFLHSLFDSVVAFFSSKKPITKDLPKQQASQEVLVQPQSQIVL